MNQKGFAPVLIILITVILCIGIFGGSYLVSKTYPNLISSADQSALSVSPQPARVLPSATASATNNSVSSSTPAAVSSGRNKLLVTERGDQYFITDLEGKNFRDIRELINDSGIKSINFMTSSPENRKLVFMTNKKDVVELSSSVRSGNFSDDVEFKIFDSQTEQFEKVDPAEFRRLFGDVVIYFPSGWSSDGSQLIFSVGDDTARVAGAQMTVISYDLKSGKVEQLAKIPDHILETYYDLGEKKLVLRITGDLGDEIKVIDITSQQSTRYPAAQIGNFRVLGNSFGPYYFRPAGGQNSNLTEMMIYPIFGNMPNARIKLSNPDQKFLRGVQWSPDYSNAQVAIVNLKNKAPNSDFSSYLFSFYSAAGRNLSSFDSARKYKIGNKEVSLLNHDGRNTPSGVFSPDGRYYLAVGMKADQDKNSFIESGPEYEWQLLDVQSGQVLTEPFTAGIKGTPLVWY